MLEFSVKTYIVYFQHFLGKVSMLIEQEVHCNELCPEYMYQDQSTKLFGQDCTKSLW